MSSSTQIGGIILIFLIVFINGMTARRLKDREEIKKKFIDGNWMIALIIALSIW